MYLSVEILIDVFECGNTYCGMNEMVVEFVSGPCNLEIKLEKDKTSGNATAG